MLVKIEINKTNLIKNINKVKKINKNIIFVLKDDAYGLGIENIIPILLEQKYYKYMVADIDEADRILLVANKYFEKNKIKDVQIEVIVLNYERIDTKIENGIREVECQNKKSFNSSIEYTIFSLFQLKKFIENLNMYRGYEEVVNIHLKMNTGMNRLGFDENEIEEISQILENNEKIQVKSIYTHISSAEDEKYTENQVNTFNEIIKKIEEKGMSYQFKHVQASPTLFKYGKKYNYDYARIGMVIYGMEPLSNNVGLYDVVTVKSKIINVRNIKKGEKVSYGDELVHEDKKVAIVAIGYSHGLQKQIENSKAYVLINGKRAYLLGEVCMDMIIVDVSHINNVSVGDDVIIIGESNNEKLTILDVARFSNTIQDDILTKFNKSIVREVIDTI